MSSTWSEPEESVATDVLSQQLEQRALPTNIYRQTWGSGYFIQIRVGGELRYLGTYPTVDEAVKVRDEARRQLGR
jgi:hypothetical protein